MNTVDITPLMATKPNWPDMWKAEMRFTGYGSFTVQFRMRDESKAFASVIVYETGVCEPWLWSKPAPYPAVDDIDEAIALIHAGPAW